MKRIHFLITHFMLLLAPIVAKWEHEDNKSEIL